MRLAFTDAGNDPTRLTTRQAYDLLAHGFGPGFNGPLVIAAELPTGRPARAAPSTGSRAALRATPGRRRRHAGRSSTRPRHAAVIIA